MCLPDWVLNTVPFSLPFVITKMGKEEEINCSALS